MSYKGLNAWYVAFTNGVPKEVGVDSNVYRADVTIGTSFGNARPPCNHRVTNAFLIQATRMVRCGGTRYRVHRVNAERNRNSCEIICIYIYYTRALIVYHRPSARGSAARTRANPCSSRVILRALMTTLAASTRNLQCSAPDFFVLFASDL